MEAHSTPCISHTGFVLDVPDSIEYEQTLACSPRQPRSASGRALYREHRGYLENIPLFGLLNKLLALQHYGVCSGAVSI